MFSIAFYSDQTSAPCLALQDRCGADVNIVLFLLWRASFGEALPNDAIQLIDNEMAPWREHVVRPLRNVRRWLKTEVSETIDFERSERLRGRVKGIELESEFLQQEALYAILERLPVNAEPDIEKAAALNLMAYAKLLDNEFPPDLLDKLIYELTVKSRGGK